MSFGKTSAGALQIKDNNDYYPFGMNHLKTGNAYFGAGSYKNYKFGGKELQEFGAYDFGARLYMNDIGRWFAVDPMAEANPGLSVYRYGFNNPIMFTDPNGMLEQAQIDHMWNNSGMGVTGWSFNKDGSPKKDSYNPMDDSDLNNLLAAFNGVASGGGSSTISFFTGSITQTSYRIGNELYTEGNFGLMHTITIRNEMNAGFDWYGPAGKGNFGFGTAATAIGFVQGSFRLTNGIYNGSAWSPKYYPSAWTGGSRARITTYNFGKVGRVLGWASFGAGIIMDGVAVNNYYNHPESENKVHPAKAGINTTMGIVGLRGGVPGAIISTLYFGIDNFYPGGWVGASETAARTEVYEQQMTGHPFFSNSAIKF